MRAKITPLKIDTFHVVKSVLEFISMVPENTVSVDDLFASYPIEIDFNHYQSDSLIKVEMNIFVNAKKKQPGYKIEVKSEGYFKIDSEGLNESQLFNLQVISTTSIMINNIRNIMSQLTAFAPIGVYILPTIDINNLINEKAKQAERQHQ